MVRRVNLVPAAERRRTSTDFGLVGVIAGALIVVAAIGISYLYFTGVADDRRAELADLQTQRQQIEAQVAELAAYEALQQEVVRTETMVQSVYAGRTLMSSLLGDMSLVVPDTVWFETMSLTAQDIVIDTGAAAVQDSEQGGQAAAPDAQPPLGTLQITGKTYEYEDVATLLVRLQQIDSFANVVLSNATAGGEDSDALKNFTITAEIVNETQPTDTPLPLTEVQVSN